MKLELIRKSWAILFLTGLIAAALGCRFSLEEEQTTYSLNLTYLIDPPTLLTTLANGEPDAFTLLTATPPDYPDFAPEPVSWMVDDFTFVAESLFNLTKNQTLDDWRLKEMAFRGGCYEIDMGFQVAIFSIFKSIPTEEDNSRVTENLVVDPNENVASILEVIYTPELDEWKSIDLSRVNIDADDALRIAEENGGEAFRNNIGNQCSVVALFDAEGKYEDWYVTYFSDDFTFDINIDASTGEYRIIRQNRK